MIQRDTLLNDISTACQTACGPTALCKHLPLWSKRFTNRWDAAHIAPNPHKSKLNSNAKAQRARANQQDTKHSHLANPHRHS
jgi:hypothetical protein